MFFLHPTTTSDNSILPLTTLILKTFLEDITEPFFSSLNIVLSNKMFNLFIAKIRGPPPERVK